MSEDSRRRASNASLSPRPKPLDNLPAVLLSIAVVAGASALLWWVDARRYRAVTHRRYLRVVARGTGTRGTGGNITGRKEATGVERL